ncbi:hypothetical protein [Bacteroides stercorirosoris]|nr:hypothetical protein [Bacteroides stercorirosoris]
MKRKVIYLTGILVTLMLVAGCSTRKNTAGTRFYHALTTRYNVYFNGNEAIKPDSKRNSKEIRTITWRCSPSTP